VPNLVTTLNFENEDNVTHLLVRDFSGSNGDDLDSNEDGLLDATPWAAIVDAVGLRHIAGPPSAAGEDWAYGQSLGFADLGPDGTVAPGHIFRLPDGGGFQVGEFDLLDAEADDTPGTANSGELLGDMDGDSDVDFDDIDDFVLGLNNPSQYESSFGVPPEVRGDTDMDGDMDFDDISGFVGILSGDGVTAVPEPTTAGLLAAACAAFMLKNRGRWRLYGV
jgi:hypothetical protein